MMAVRTCSGHETQAPALGADIPAALPIGPPVTSLTAPQSYLVKARSERFAATKDTTDGGSL